MTLVRLPPPPPPPLPVRRVEELRRPEELIALDPFAQSQFRPQPSYVALGGQPPPSIGAISGPTFRQNPSVNGLTPINQGWRPDPTKPNFGIELDPSRSDELSYMKDIMQKVWMVQGKGAPTKEDYDYWIPKFLTIGDDGLDAYWLNKMLKPPDDDAPLSDYENGQEYWPAIRDIMANFDDATADEMIAKLLGKKNKKKDKAGTRSPDGANATGGGDAAAAGGDAPAKA